MGGMILLLSSVPIVQEETSGELQNIPLLLTPKNLKNFNQKCIFTEPGSLYSPRETHARLARQVAILLRSQERGTSYRCRSPV